MRVDSGGKSNLTSHRPDSRRTLSVIMLARVALNLQFRVVYPFLPAIGRGLGVPLEQVSLLLTARSLMGATSPLYGFLADRYGRRAWMLAGLAALLVGTILVGIAPSFWVALAAFALLGLSKAAYDPAMQAYISDAVPYAQRGRVLAFIELSWSLSWLIGVPAAGFAIAAAGWRSPFWAIAGLGAISLLLTWRSHPARHTAPNSSPPPARASTFAQVSALRPAALALAVSFLLMMANDNVFIVYGAWMEDQFGLAVSAVGVASIVVSLAELAAEGTSAGIVDRLGKRRAVLTGLLLNVLAYLLLPRLAGTLVSALVGVALMFVTFEFSIVSMLPLMSELVPEARGTVMALNSAAMAAGRVVSSLTGPRLWLAGGLPLNTIVSACVVLVASLILWRGVREA